MATLAARTLRCRASEVRFASSYLRQHSSNAVERRFTPRYRSLRSERFFPRFWADKNMASWRVHRLFAPQTFR
eukprot:9356513-Alexandrium_andersonii.AAC.1